MGKLGRETKDYASAIVIWTLKAEGSQPTLVHKHIETSL